MKASPPDETLKSALQMSSAFELGYTSQDWIETEKGFYFVDLNPSGQWLFLPEPLASAISSSVADWLSQLAGGDHG